MHLIIQPTPTAYAEENTKYKFRHHKKRRMKPTHHSAYNPRKKSKALLTISNSPQSLDMRHTSQRPHIQPYLQNAIETSFRTDSSLLVNPCPKSRTEGSSSLSNTHLAGSTFFSSTSGLSRPAAAKSSTEGPCGMSTSTAGSLFRDLRSAVRFCRTIK